MSSRLVPCAHCSRHVRLDSERCPFCDAVRIPSPATTPSAAPTARLSSLAVMTFRAATLGVAITACGGESNDPGGHGGATGTGGGGAAAGEASNGGVNDNGSGGTPGSASGGRSQVGSGGQLDGTAGGPVPIYRATPRG